MDAVAEYNAKRWAALVGAGAVFTRPYLDLDAASAQQLLDPAGRLGPLQGKRVLCLASGGGQQSVAFVLLDAQVTVVDLAEAQLARDEEAARHYGLTITPQQADMRDLSALPAATFDVVYHPYSINFVPDVRTVFGQVARVIRPGGVYQLMCANPCFAGLLASDWDGQGYPLRRPYVTGMPVHYIDEPWVFRGELPATPIGGPIEYRHTWSELVNGLVDHGFSLIHLQEENLSEPDFSAEPGTNEHFTAVAPPWLWFWAKYGAAPAAQGAT
jgi:SAM-dependent methyltransferase